MRLVLALLGLLMFCSQAGPALAAVTYSTTGQLVGINAAGNTVGYSIPAGHVLVLTRVTFKPRQNHPVVTNGQGGAVNSTVSLIGSAYINGFIVASYADRATRMVAYSAGVGVADSTDFTDGRLDLQLAGGTAGQVVTFAVDTGFTASWIGYLVHPDSETPECVCEPVPLTSPEPSPTPLPSSEPSAPPSVEPTPVPSSEPSTSPPGGGSSTPWMFLGFGYQMATDYMLLADRVANIVLGIVFLLLVLRKTARFV